MPARTIEIFPVTRVEGHLEFSVDVEAGRVTDARSIGAEFRGFEIMLRGRDPTDALVFVQRICGVCPTSHMTAAVEAQDSLHKVEVPPNGHLVRSLMLALENTYSHAAHFYVLFAPDLVNKKYSDHPAYKELVRRLAPFSGTSYVKAVKAKRLLNETYAIFGGQFPHSVAFIPGGVTSTPNVSDITRAIGIWIEVKRLVEDMVLGCSVERWLENKSLKDVERWLGEDPAHANSDLGLFIKLGQELGLHKIGVGPGKFVSYGVFRQADGKNWLKSGYYDGEFHALDQTKIAEHVKHSWFTDYEGGKHPSVGETSPTHTGLGAKYSYLKSPRFDGNVVEVGPLARQINDQDSLALDLAKELGPSVFVRVLARLHEAVRMMAQVRLWIDEIDPTKPLYRKPDTWPKTPDGVGIGMTEAGRGALGHWLNVDGGKIKNYQVITPTAWNASPRDYFDNQGAIERAATGTPVADETNPVEVFHVIRSFDPCLSCATHIISGGKTYTFRVV